MKLLILILTTFLVSSFGVHAQTFNILDKEESAKLTGNYVEFTSKIKSIEEALHAYKNKKDIKYHNQIVRKYSKKPVWYAFTVKNSINEEINRIIQLPFGSTRLMELYIIAENDQYEKISARQSVPISKRKHQFRRLTADLTFKPLEQKFIIAKIQSYNQVSGNFDITSFEKHQAYESSFKTLSILYVGIVFALFIYNVFISINSKNIAINYYSLMIFVLSSFILIIGDIPQYFNFVMPEFIHKMIPFHRSLLIYVMTLFLTNFLNAKKITPKLNSFFMIYASWSVFIGAMSYFESSYNFVNIIIKNLLTLNLIMMISYSMFVAFKTRSRPAIIFSIATSSLFVSGLLFILSWGYGIIPREYVTEDIVLFGSGIEMILFSLAIADNFKHRISEEFNRRKDIESELLNLNTFLEKKVKEQTNQNLSSKRRAALGEMATGVAHEMNSPLSAIYNSIQYQDFLMQKKHVDLIKVSDLNLKNLKILKNIFNLTHKLKIYGESYGDVHKEVVDIDSLIKDVISRSDHKIYYTDEKSIFIETHKAHLINVLSCLFNIAQVGNSTNFVSVSQDDSFISIEITGTNKKLPDWIINYIEIPFYAHKGENKGSGLELSLAKDALEAIGGSIKVSHEEEFIFKIIIPDRRSAFRKVA